MAHTSAEIRSDEIRSDETQNDETRGALRLVEWDVFPPTLEPARLEPPTHPALPRLRPGRLRFAPAPVDRTDKPTAPARRPRRVDWGERLFEAGWMVLALGCAAECVYRLLWAVQP